MPLSDQARHARQKLVVGDGGQGRLCAATFALTALGPEAAAIARTYLERAGLSEAEGSAPPSGPSETATEATLSGARFAVRAIAAVLEEG